MSRGGIIISSKASGRGMILPEREGSFTFYRSPFVSMIGQKDKIGNPSSKKIIIRSIKILKNAKKERPKSVIDKLYPIKNYRKIKTHKQFWKKNENPFFKKFNKKSEDEKDLIEQIDNNKIKEHNNNNPFSEYFDRENISYSDIAYVKSKKLLSAPKTPLNNKYISMKDNYTIPIDKNVINVDNIKEEEKNCNDNNNLINQEIKDVKTHNDENKENINNNKLNKDINDNKEEDEDKKEIKDPLLEEDDLDEKEKIDDIINYLNGLDYDKYCKDMELREALSLLKHKMDKEKEEKALNNDINTLNIKYKENKKILTEKEKELNDLKEASQAILIKQKNLIEKENTIDKDKCKIITDKIHNNLKWYLIYEKKNNEINIEEQYDNYRWVTGLIIKDEYLDRYNKYQSDTQRIKDLEDYVLNLQKKLEAKEESMSKLDYKNKKLIQEIHNKTGETRHIHNVLSRGVSSKIKKNTSTELSTNCNDNIFAELNKKKDKINDEEKIANLMSQQKVDEFLNKNAGEEEDFDEVKQIQKQMKFLKKELKETRNILELLTDQVKELIKNVKCDNKNKPQIVQICQLLNLSPETTKRIVTNNKKGIKI